MKLYETHALLLRHLVCFTFFIYWIPLEYLLGPFPGSFKLNWIPPCPAWFGFWPNVPERIKFEKVLIVTWATSFVGRNHGIVMKLIFSDFFLVENRVHKITHIRILISKPLFHLLMFLFHSVWRRYRPISPLLTCGYVAWHWVPPAVVEAYSYQLAPKANILESINLSLCVPSRELTYPTLGKGKSSSEVPWDRIC